MAKAFPAKISKFFYSRWMSFFGMLFCFGLLGFAAYLQLHLNLLPCPLCVLQRILFFIISLIFLVGALYTPHEQFGKRFHSGLIFFFGLLGALLSARHVWLTLQPPSQLTSCSPTLEYMFQNMPLNESLKILFLGSGDCAKVTFRLFTLSIPQWTLILFAAICVFALIRYIVAQSDQK